MTLVCEVAPDGAKGYTFRFAANVQGGMLHGERGQAGQRGSLVLQGMIGPDGNALLQGSGLTDNPDYAVGHVREATVYSYRMQAQFDERHGTGKRIDQRPCTADFVRQ